MIDALSLLSIGCVSAFSSLAISVLIVRRQIPSLRGEIDQYITELGEDVKAHPQKYADLAGPVMAGVMNKLMANLPPGVVNGEGASPLDMLPIPKKWKGLAQLAMMFMNRGNESAAQGSKSGKGLG